MGNMCPDMQADIGKKQRISKRTGSYYADTRRHCSPSIFMRQHKLDLVCTITHSGRICHQPKTYRCARRAASGCSAPARVECFTCQKQLAGAHALRRSQHNKVTPIAVETSKSPLNSICQTTRKIKGIIMLNFNQSTRTRPSWRMTEYTIKELNHVQPCDELRLASSQLEKVGSGVFNAARSRKPAKDSQEKNESLWIEAP